MKKQHSSRKSWPSMRVAALLCTALFATSFSGQAQSTTWKFIAVGDTRDSAGTTQTINTAIVKELADQIVAQGAKFVIVPGDLVYSGNYSAFQEWKTAMAPVYAANIGVLPVMGNHDAADVASWLQIFGPDVPDNGAAGEVNRTFAFAYQNALILGLDNYVNLGRVNQAWVNSILQQNTLPHVFAFGHLPAFKANHTDCLDDYPTARDAFWNSLKNANVAVYFCGHDHFYDHARIDDGDGNVNNDVHQLIVGCGGAPFHTTYAYDGVNTSWTPRNVYHEAEYGYTVVEIDGLTATLTFYHRTAPGAYAATGDVWSYTVNTVPQPPSPPTGVSATAGDARVTLQWNAVTDATSYSVKRAVGSPTGTYDTIAAAVTATSYTDTTVANGLTYYYVVTAINANGESANSAYVSATPTAPPPAPTGLAAVSGPRKGQITLTWNKSTGATGYNLNRSTTSGGPYALVKKVAKPNYTDSKLTSGVTYYYVVTALTAAGESAPCNERFAVAK